MVVFMNRQQHVLMKIIEKIQVFVGLSVQEVQNLLAISALKQFEKGDIVYRQGEPSNDMIVLIQGHLKVMGKNGQTLVDIPSGTSIGEMGFFTRQPRSATIVAAEKSVGLLIEHLKLNGLLTTERNMKAVILQNVVDLLAKRLIETDRKLEAYMKKESEAGQNS